MKKVSIVLSLICMVLSLSLVLSGCSTNKSGQQPSSTPDASVHVSPQVSAKPSTRTITDLAGNTVEIPAASEINKVVIVAPPLLATYASVVKDTSKIVGVHTIALSQVNKDLLNTIVPNWESINTSFLAGFTSNAEEVLKLDPDIILVYGAFMKDGLENVDIPIVDFCISDQQNESWSVQIDTLMREIFDTNDNTTLQSEWDKANEVVSTALQSVDKCSKKTAVMIMSNTGDAITVRGIGSYGDDWLVKTGLVNVAGELKGDGVAVTMEQLYEWNPDIIYVFQGVGAAKYLENSIGGQDWSEINAFKDGKIYDMPYGMFNWGSPNADSPLTLIWMTMKNYPDLIKNDYFITYMKDYYQRQYGITPTDKTIDLILNPTR